MHLLLTDILTCPRCGPEFGLILLADRLENRRVVEGWLGCSNCREQYAVRSGVVDLRFPPGRPAAPVSGAAADPEAALRLAALLGLSEPGGTVLIAGPGARLAPGMSALADGIEVAVLDSGAVPDGTPPAVNRILSDAAIPFASGSLRAVALTGGDALLDEAARVLAPGGRLVVELAGPEVANRLRQHGLEVLLNEDGTAVASLLRGG